MRTRSLPVLLLAWVLSASMAGQSLPELGRWDTVAVFGTDGAALDNPWTGGLTAPQFSAADFDADGVQDLFVFDREGNRILPFQGCVSDVPEAPLTYLYRPDWREAFPEDMRNWVLIRDANCDGVPDVFHNSQSGIRMWLGQSSENFVSYPNDPGANLFGNWNFGSGDQELPLVCLPTDIPALGDFDGDGDLDMVTWTETSSTLYAYTGRGAEEGSVGCGDTLVWDVTNRCYGMLNEASEDNTLFIGEDHVCGNNVFEPRWEEGELVTATRHAGGTTALLELDGDGHLDLLLGDVSYNSLTACYMVEAIDGQDSTTSTNDTWPADLGGIGLDLQRFPAAFPLDVDQDGVQDLLLAPNVKFEVNGRQGVWFYRNAGTEDQPTWDLQNTAFLQDGMIDVGRGAYPAFTDFDDDGLTDLVVACKERYYGPGNTPALLARFRNVGTANAPAFEQLDTNWLSLPDYGLESVVPAFGDLDGDGDDELLIGDELGNLHLWTNLTDGEGPAQYSLTGPSLSDAEGETIDVGQFAAPCLHDLDGDGDLDLLVGEKNGGIQLFENTGSPTAASFALISANAGQVDVDNLLGINGFPVPAILPTDSGDVLVVGNELGHLEAYALPESPLDQVDSTWLQLTDQWNGLVEGEFAAPALADLDGDGAEDLIVGVRNGGVTLWRSGGESVVRLCPPPIINATHPLPVRKGWIPHPNPVAPGNTMAVPAERLRITDLLGREIAVLTARGGQVVLPESLAGGTYLALPEGRETATGAPWLGSARRIVVGPVR